MKSATTIQESAGDKAFTGAEFIFRYTDERGELLYEVLRYPGKKFMVRRPGPDGSLIWNLDGVGRVPYRLEEVALADSIVLVEGEKDCETLRKIGIVASTNNGGSNGWRTELAQYFSGKHVAVIPDRDPPGARWAELVVADLRPVTRSLRMITLPGLKENSGEDVTDWLAQGHTKEELVALLNSAPSVREVAPRPPHESGGRAATSQKLPHSEPSERAILGAILLDGSALDCVAEILKEEDFFVEKNRDIFSTMLALAGSQRAIDAITLQEALRTQGHAGWAQEYISKLTDGMPRVSHVAHYAKIVREKALLRNLFLAGRAIQQKAFGAGEPASEILDSSLSLIDQLAMEGSTERGAVTVRDAIQSAQPILTRLSEGKGAILGAATGYRWLDEKLAGWVPGEYVVLAGRPSKGKTALALEFIRRQCEAGNPTVLFSKEMNRAAIIIRLACLVARVDSHKLRSGWLSKMEWDRVAAALGRIGEWKLWIDDRPGMRSAEVRWRLRSLAKRHGIKLAVADYLQIFGAPGKDRFEKVTHASMDFQMAAHELGEISGGTFLVLAQLGRQADERKPQLSDLRESGQIEQDADTVLFLFDDDEKEIKPGQKEPYGKFLEVAKQRNGPCGVTTLTFIPHFMGFEPQGGEPEEHVMSPTEVRDKEAVLHPLPSDEEFFGK